MLLSIDSYLILSHYQKKEREEKRKGEEKGKEKGEDRRGKKGKEGREERRKEEIYRCKGNLLCQKLWLHSFFKKKASIESKHSYEGQNTKIPSLISKMSHFTSREIIICINVTYNENNI